MILRHLSSQWNSTQTRSHKVQLSAVLATLLMDRPSGRDRRKWKFVSLKGRFCHSESKIYFSTQINYIYRRTEFTVDMLAEYDWPQNESGKNRDTYMIQEQIAEYLGIKSFKRKYPDLVRRPVDMEERNFLFENGLASEKMCDLGLTAIYASEVLDIMCSDYPEKYEEYKRYQREKIFKHARLRLETAVVDRSQMQKDKAITSASDWNTRFNKE